MTDEKMFMRRKPNLNVGAIGHIDHGKTTLAAAIATVLSKQYKAKATNYNEIVNTPEKGILGVPINSAHVEYETETRHYTHIDCPSHEDYIKIMITDVAQLDGAILVVSATDGIMPQTREHVLLSRQVGVQCIVVYLNKCDQVDDENIFEIVENEIRSLLIKYGFNGANTVIIRGSALMSLNGEDNDKGHGISSIKKLMDALDSVIPEPIKNIDIPFLMPIEDAVSIVGRGTMVTGKIERGVIEYGEEVEIVGLRDDLFKAIVIGIEAFKKQAPRGEAGYDVGLLLRRINKDEIERGMVLAKPGSIKAHTKFKAAIYIKKSIEGGRETTFYTKCKHQLYFRNIDLTGQMIELRDGEDLKILEMAISGDNINATVYLSRAVAVATGSCFAIRESGKIIGYGVIVEILE